MGSPFFAFSKINSPLPAFGMRDCATLTRFGRELGLGLVCLLFLIVGGMLGASNLLRASVSSLSFSLRAAVVLRVQRLGGEGGICDDCDVSVDNGALGEVMSVVTGVSADDGALDEVMSVVTGVSTDDGALGEVAFVVTAVV